MQTVSEKEQRTFKTSIEEDISSIEARSSTPTTPTRYRGGSRNLTRKKAQAKSWGK